MSTSVGIEDQEIERRIRGALGELMAEDLSDLDRDTDLIEFGVHSLLMIDLAAQWRRRGVELNFADLALEPTLRAWCRLVAERTAQRVAAATADVPAGRRSDDATFGLATMQHAYWVGRMDSQALGGVAAHLYAEFDGASVDPDRLAAAVAELVGRHEMLRVRFDDNGRQRILDRTELPNFRLCDLRAADPDTVAAELKAIRQRNSHQLLDVARGQVFVVDLTLLPAGRTRVHVDVDMLAADAMSYRTLLRDLAAGYAGDGASLAPIGYSYRQYLSEHAASRARARAVAEQWWAGMLDELPDPPALPLIPESARADPHRSTRREYHVGPAAKRRLLARSRAAGVTPAVVLATVFAEVVGRWSGEQRMLLNLPLFDREPLHDDVRLLAGDFTSSIMVAVDANRDRPFVDTVRAVQAELHRAAAHSAYPGLEVIRDLGRHRGAAVLAPVVYTSGMDLGELFADSVLAEFGDPVWIISQGPQVVLDAQVVELRGGLLTNWDVREDAFRPGVIDAMFARYSAELDRLLAPESDWSVPFDLRLPADQAARRAALNALSAPESGRALHEPFFDQAAVRPDAVALLWSAGGTDHQLRYRELADRALRLAARLRAAGVDAGDVVSIQLPRGPWQIIAVLAVLAAGGTYLPIGVDQPAERRRLIQDAAGTRLAIVDDADTAAAQHLPAVALDALDLAGIEPVEPRFGAADTPAYILFTSGSTGTPKGVQVPHRAVMNTLERCQELYEVRPADRSIVLSALEFDVSIQDIFAPLAVGGSVVAIDDTARRDGRLLAGLIERLGVTQLYCVPGILGMILDAVGDSAALHGVRTVVVAGDKAGRELALRLFAAAPTAVFAGMGGATETAIHHTVAIVPREIPADWSVIPFGRPLANLACRVVSPTGHDCPDWVVGELWVSGVGIADGYVGDPERTAERFVEEQGVRWYCTGDLVSWRDDGLIDVVGRVDDQIKLRGYRIEPGEVAAVLSAEPEVGRAVVEVDRCTGSAALLAAVTAVDPDADPAALGTQLRSRLADRLPAYMIPDRITVLDSIPLTGNGKVDHRALSAMLVAVAGERDYAPPRTDLETALALVLGQFLGVSQLGRADDFFALGGDSVRATAAIARIMTWLDTDEVAVSDLLLGRTVGAVAQRMLARSSDPERLAEVAAICVDVATMSDDEVAEALDPAGSDSPIPEGTSR